MANITDERLSITADLGFRLHDDEVRAIAAELLAARARIAKLEQEPPMALVDFGVGVNWKGLHEDMQRLRAERDAARAEVAEAKRLDGVRLSQIASLQEIIRNDTTPAGVEVARFRVEVERLRGIIDDIEVESGHCHFLDDEEHEPPHLPDHVRAIVQERDAARAEVERLRAELRRMSEWHDQIADTVPCDVAGPHYGIVEWHLKVLAERDAARADLREAMELLRLARGRFQSYEECDQDYCADGSDHQPRERMDALLAKHKETP